MKSSERPVVPIPARCALPGFPGVPWWGALALAVGATALGAAVDMLSSSTEITSTFNWLYVIGCVAAVLLVANTGLFTAVVQPALILFCAVPLTTWLLSSDQQVSGKNALLLAFPLIKRFPWMAWTAAAALLIGLVRLAMWRLDERKERLGARKAAAAPRRRSSVDQGPAPRRAEERATASSRQNSSARRRPSVQGAPAAPDEAVRYRRSTAPPPRPRIDPRTLDSARHTPSFGLPPLPAGSRGVAPSVGNGSRTSPAGRTLPNGARYRREEPPYRWEEPAPAATPRAGRHAMPPSPRRTPPARRRED